MAAVLLVVVVDVVVMAAVDVGDAVLLHQALHHTMPRQRQAAIAPPSIPVLQHRRTPPAFSTLDKAPRRRHNVFRRPPHQRSSLAVLW